MRLFLLLQFSLASIMLLDELKMRSWGYSKNVRLFHSWKILRTPSSLITISSLPSFCRRSESECDCLGDDSSIFFLALPGGSPAFSFLCTSKLSSMSENGFRLDLKSIYYNLRKRKQTMEEHLSTASAIFTSIRRSSSESGWSRAAKSNVNPIEAQITLWSKKTTKHKTEHLLKH